MVREFWTKLRNGYLEEAGRTSELTYYRTKPTAPFPQQKKIQPFSQIYLRSSWYEIHSFILQQPP